MRQALRLAAGLLASLALVARMASHRPHRCSPGCLAERPRIQALAPMSPLLQCYSLLFLSFCLVLRSLVSA